MLYDIDDISTRWNYYCAKLYEGHGKTEEEDMIKGGEEPEVRWMKVKVKAFKAGEINYDEEDEEDNWQNLGAYYFA